MCIWDARVSFISPEQFVYECPSHVESCPNTCTHVYILRLRWRACSTSVVMWDENFLYLQIENGLYRWLRCRYCHLAFFQFVPDVLSRWNQRSNGRWRLACHHQQSRTTSSSCDRRSMGKAKFVCFFFCDGPIWYMKTTTTYSSTRRRHYRPYFLLGICSEAKRTSDTFAFRTIYIELAIVIVGKRLYRLEYRHGSVLLNRLIFMTICHRKFGCCCRYVAITLAPK